MRFQPDAYQRQESAHLLKMTRLAYEGSKKCHGHRAVLWQNLTGFPRKDYPLRPEIYIQNSA